MSVRMFLTLKFNKELNYMNTHISPGGYQVAFKDFGCVAFDFYDTYSSVIHKDTIRYELRDLSCVSFDYADQLEHLLRTDSIEMITECNVFIDEEYEVVGIERMAFELYDDEHGYTYIELPKSVCDNAIVVSNKIGGRHGTF